MSMHSSATLIDVHADEALSQCSDSLLDACRQAAQALRRRVGQLKQLVGGYVHGGDLQQLRTGLAPLGLWITDEVPEPITRKRDLRDAYGVHGSANGLRLVRAVERPTYDVVRRIADDPELQATDASSALEAAIETENIIMIQLLLLLLRVPSQWSPLGSLLFAAIEAGFSKLIVQQLLDAGADVSACHGLHNMTPLHLAVASRDSLLVQLLVDAGADLNVQDIHGRTPLCLAAAIEDGDVLARQLLAAGAAISLETFDHCNAMAAAAAHNSICCLQLLLTEIPRGGQGAEPLHVRGAMRAAARSGTAAALQMLLNFDPPSASTMHDLCQLAAAAGHTQLALWLSMLAPEHAADQPTA